MAIPPNYTPVKITVPDDGKCISVYHIWKTIYYTNQDTFSYISCISLARTYNLIYALIKTKNLKLLNSPYTKVPTSSAENIEFYKLNNNICLILKEENNMQEIITFDGTQFWYKDGKQHRDNDLPAIIYTDSTQIWLKNGSCHRDNDLPALIYSNGTQYWYKDGNLHRDNDLPAAIYEDGTQEYYQNGVQYDYPS